MQPSLIPFRNFNDIALAYQLVELLKENNIEYLLEDVPTTFDLAFRAKNAETREYVVNIKDSDFNKVNALLEEEAVKGIEQLDTDHYLFQFTNEELREVLIKRDEWNATDVLLARKILNDRGHKITDDEIKALNRGRMESLRQPEPSQSTWIIVGYICALAGGLLGIFIGWHLSTQKKTLPNGERVYDYRPADRQHGRIIFYVSIISTIIFMIVRISRMYEY